MKKMKLKFAKKVIYMKWKMSISNAKKILLKI